MFTINYSPFAASKMIISDKKIVLGRERVDLNDKLVVYNSSTSGYLGICDYDFDNFINYKPFFYLDKFWYFDFIHYSLFGKFSDKISYYVRFFPFLITANINGDGYSFMKRDDSIFVKFDELGNQKQFSLPIKNAITFVKDKLLYFDAINDLDDGTYFYYKFFDEKGNLVKTGSTKISFSNFSLFPSTAINESVVLLSFGRYENFAILSFDDELNLKYKIESSGFCYPSIYDNYLSFVSNGKLFVYDVNTGESVAEISGIDTGGYNNLIFNGSKLCVAYANSDDTSWYYREYAIDLNNLTADLIYSQDKKQVIMLNNYKFYYENNILTVTDYERNKVVFSKQLDCLCFFGCDLNRNLVVATPTKIYYLNKDLPSNAYVEYPFDYNPYNGEEVDATVKVRVLNGFNEGISANVECYAVSDNVVFSDGSRKVVVSVENGEADLGIKIVGEGKIIISVRIL